MRGRDPYPVVLRLKAVAMYVSGKSQKDVAAELGVAQDTVSRWLAAARVVKRPAQRNRIPEDVRRAILAAKGHEKACTVAAKWGVAKQTVSRLWNERAHSLGMGR